MSIRYFRALRRCFLLRETCTRKPSVLGVFDERDSMQYARRQKVSSVFLQNAQREAA